MLYPLVFEPILQHRIWGGRSLETLYGKNLPPGSQIGESWEISDRPDAVSIISNGSLAGKSLRWLMENHLVELMGKAEALNGRFPLLIKILDAREKLSLQVHPPARLAAELNGEPKTEMWYFAQAEPDAEIFAGLKAGVTEPDFTTKTHDGTVADCFHRIPVRQGDAMFLPSGRVHALGQGMVIFEIQQNSDTTYRVFDWNRIDSEGKTRDLHIEQSLRCIDFEDVEPSLVQVDEPLEVNGVRISTLVDHQVFRVDLVEAQTSATLQYSLDRPLVVGVVTGNASIQFGGEQIDLSTGKFSLIPPNLPQVDLIVNAQSRLLLASPR